jgi:hypothetical protein
MLCKDLKPGMLLFLKHKKLEAWIVKQTLNNFYKLKIGTAESSAADGLVTFISKKTPLLYLGQKQIEINENKRNIRVFYIEKEICYIECFDIHNLEN